MKTLLKTSFFAILLAISSSIYSATDGIINNVSSTGTFTIIATKQDAVLITKMTDISFTPTPLTVVDLVQSDTVCYLATTSNYYVDINGTTGTGSNSGKFVLKNGSVELPYSVSWTDNTTTQTFLPTTNPIIFISNNTTESDCGGKPGQTNATIEVLINKTDYNNSPVGSYNDTVSVIISAN